MKEEKSEEKITAGENKSQKRQTKVLVVVLFLILLMAAIVLLTKSKVNQFSYAGLTFEKIKFDKLDLYHAKIPIKSVTGQVINKYNLYFRNDPRELEKQVPLKTDLALMKNVVIAAEPEMVCPNELIAGISLTNFLDSAGIDVFMGSTNKTEAKEKNVSYVSCGNESYTLVRFELANRTEIVKEDINCYKLKISNCQVMEAAERFMIGVVNSSKKDFT
jgi:hypothetical protein